MVGGATSMVTFGTRGLREHALHVKSKACMPSNNAIHERRRQRTGPFAWSGENRTRWSVNNNAVCSIFRGFLGVLIHEKRCLESVFFTRETSRVVCAVLGGD